MLLANRRKSVNTTALPTDISRTDAEGAIWLTSAHADLAGTQVNLPENEFLLVFGGYCRGGLATSILEAVFAETSGGKFDFLLAARVG